MCPLCLSNVAMAVAGVLSGSGIAALAVQQLATVVQENTNKKNAAQYSSPR
jgi:hypothetical protein